MSRRHGPPSSRQIGDFLADYLKPSVWGETDCLRMAQGYLRLWGIKTALPQWIEDEKTEKAAVVSSVSRYGSLTECFAFELQKQVKLAEIWPDKLSPPAIGLVTTHPARLDRLPMMKITDGGLAVLNWDGWFMRLSGGLAAMESKVGRVWIPV